MTAPPTSHPRHRAPQRKTSSASKQGASPRHDHRPTTERTIPMTKAATIDILSINTVAHANQGVPLELRGPDGAPLLADGKPVTITLLGEDSEVMTKFSNEQANRYLRQQGQTVVTAEGARANTIDRLATATVGWSGFSIGGEEWPCDREHARKLYTEFPWIRDQAAVFIADRANFTKASRTS